MSLMRELGVDRLTIEQQVELALSIWDSLGANVPNRQLSADEAEEIDRRDRELDEYPELAKTWDEIRNAILQRAGS